MIKMRAQTFITALILLLAVIVAGAIALKGDPESNVVNGEQQLVDIPVSGTMPDVRRASEASLVPQPEQPRHSPDPVPARPNNWR